MLDRELQNEIIRKNRNFTKGYQANDPYGETFESDQELKLPQPPLMPMRMQRKFRKKV